MLHTLRCALPVLAMALFAPGPAIALAVNDADSSTPNPNCELRQSADWRLCIDQQVEIRGRIPAVVLQHPMIAAPGLDGGAAEVQSYVETADGTQVILLSVNENTCAGTLIASGTLQAIRMEGSDGSKLSYQGWALRGAAIRCLDDQSH